MRGLWENVLSPSTTSVELQWRQHSFSIRIRPYKQHGSNNQWIAKPAKAFFIKCEALKLELWEAGRTSPSSPVAYFPQRGAPKVIQYSLASLWSTSRSVTSTPLLPTPQPTQICKLSVCFGSYVNLLSFGLESVGKSLPTHLLPTPTPQSHQLFLFFRDFVHAVSSMASGTPSYPKAVRNPSAWCWHRSLHITPSL